jgi:hypothetical protein
MGGVTTGTPILSSMAAALRSVLITEGAVITHWEINAAVWKIMADQMRSAEFERYLENVEKWGALLVAPFTPSDFSYRDGVTLFGYPAQLTTRAGWRLCFTHDGKETAYDGEWDE